MTIMEVEKLNARKIGMFSTCV